MSTAFNTMSCSVHDDIILPLVPNNRLSKNQSLFIMKGTILLMGITGLAFVRVIWKVTSLQQFVVSAVALTNGAALALFISGMINPWINNKGVIAGAITGVVLPSWLFYSCVDLMSEGKLIHYPKLLSATGCNQTRLNGIGLNKTSLGFRGYGTRVHMELDDLEATFGAISYLWYSTVSVVGSILVGVLVSIFTGVTDPATVDPSLLVPQLRWLLPKPTIDRWRARQESQAGEEELKPLS